MDCNCTVVDTVIKKPPKIKIIDSHHRVGAHVGLRKTLLETISQPTASKSHCVQLYLGGRSNYGVRNIDIEDKKKTVDYCNTFGKTFYIHCPLIANLSKDPKTICDDRSMLCKSVKAVVKETEIMNGLPGGCVLHIGSKGSINNVINNINDLQIPRNSHISQKKLLILENAAGQGSSLGRNWDELRKIFEGVDRNTVGLCLDTQHIFGAGINRMENHEDVVKLFDMCESVYGTPDVIHLNDSKKVFNSKVDRHEGIGKGYIWLYQDEGLKYLLERCYEKDIDCILETPTSSQDLDLIINRYMNLQTVDV